MHPKLSIIIVNNQTENLLEHCLRSLHSATKEHLEVIVVDQSPEGGFHGRLVRKKAEHVLKSSGVSGHYFIASGEHYPASFGADHAQGNFFCFLDPRCILGGHSLSRLLEWVEHHSRTVVGPRVINPKGDIATTVFPLSGRLTGTVGARHEWQPWLSWLNRDFTYADLCRMANKPELVPALGTGCIVMPADVWRDVGPWSGGGDEVDRAWFKRAQDLGVVAWYIPTAEATKQK